MNYFYVEPEVSGGFGKNTALDSTTHPPVVSKLHYEFSGWLGDILLESFPCEIITKEAATALGDAGLSGFTFDKVEVSASQEFQDMHPHRRIPEFLWLKITGVAGADDFGIAKDFRMVVSDKALHILKTLGIDNALIEKFGL